MSTIANHSQNVNPALSQLTNGQSITSFRKQIFEYLVNKHKYTGNRKEILWVLINHTSLDGRSRLGHKKHARLTYLSISTIRRHLKKIEKDGEITIHKNQWQETNTTSVLAFQNLKFHKSVKLTDVLNINHTLRDRDINHHTKDEYFNSPKNDDPPSTPPSKPSCKAKKKLSLEEKRKILEEIIVAEPEDIKFHMRKVIEGKLNEKFTDFHKYVKTILENIYSKSKGVIMAHVKNSYNFHHSASEIFNAYKARENYQNASNRAIGLAQKRMAAEGHVFPQYDSAVAPHILYDRQQAFAAIEMKYIHEELEKIRTETQKQSPAQFGRPYYD